MNKPLKGFITYSHKNKKQKDELRKRFAVMEQKNELVTWDDGQFTPGDEAFHEDILEKVSDSDILLYLVCCGIKRVGNTHYKNGVSARSVTFSNVQKLRYKFFSCQTHILEKP